MKPAPDFEQLKQSVDEVGMYVERETHGFSAFNVDLVFPFIIGTLCLRGEARALYDMQEMVQRPNDFGFIMPGHVMRPLSCSEDFIFTRVIVSAKMFRELAEGQQGRVLVAVELKNNTGQLRIVERSFNVTKRPDGVMKIEARAHRAFQQVGGKRKEFFSLKDVLEKESVFPKVNKRPYQAEEQRNRGFAV